MSVVITVIGADQASDEYQGALRLKSLFEHSLADDVIGQITLHANATVFGQEVKDIDILMIGSLQNYSEKLQFTQEGIVGFVEDKVRIQTFCTAIELKRHDVSAIFVEGTEFYVKYRERAHSVTSQSNKQKTSVFNFFHQTMQTSPYVTNLIWFTEITGKDVRNLTEFMGGSMLSNVFGGNVTAKDIMQLLVYQRPPRRYEHGGRVSYSFDCSNGIPFERFDLIVQQFLKAKQSMGELTRRRIEQITRATVSESITVPKDNKMVIYRGRAGTGKTVGLIQTAIQLVDDMDARVLILTYNKALVADIRRLFTLASLPDMFQESCVSINTMHAFFLRLISKCLYDGKLSGETFLKDTERYLSEMLEYLSAGDSSTAVLKELLGKDYYLDWDYCLVDEAQDWSEHERDLLLEIFGPNHIIVADGGQQYVRGLESCDWNVVSERKPVKLKRCLRQKSNIVQFINHYLNMIGSSEQKITASDKLSGGKVIVWMNPGDELKMLSEEMAALTNAGNIPYDMLVLTPHWLVRKSDDDPEVHHFALKDQFEKRGIMVWDGTNEETRSNYPGTGDEIRVLQYESARGLEAWTVVCLYMDVFIKEILSAYDPATGSSSLLLESEEDRKKKYLLNWILIPWTRAIDTLVITIKDPSSDIAKCLTELAHEHKDYIFIK